MHFVHKLSMKHFEFQFINKFIRWFHQSWIPNLGIFLANICYDFFFNWQTEKRNLFWKLVKQIGKNIWWIR